MPFTFSWGLSGLFWAFLFPSFSRYLLEIVTGEGRGGKQQRGFDRIKRKAPSPEKGPSSSRIWSRESQVGVREPPCQWQVARWHFWLCHLFPLSQDTWQHLMPQEACSSWTSHWPAPKRSPVPCPVHCSPLPSSLPSWPSEISEKMFCCHKYTACPALGHLSSWCNALQLRDFLESFRMCFPLQFHPSSNLQLSPGQRCKKGPELDYPYHYN